MTPKALLALFCVFFFCGLAGCIAPAQCYEPVVDDKPLVQQTLINAAFLNDTRHSDCESKMASIVSKIASDPAETVEVYSSDCKSDYDFYPLENLVANVGQFVGRWSSDLINGFLCESIQAHSKFLTSPVFTLGGRSGSDRLETNIPVCAKGGLLAFGSLMANAWAPVLESVRNQTYVSGYGMMSLYLFVDLFSFAMVIVYTTFIVVLALQVIYLAGLKVLEVGLLCVHGLLVPIFLIFAANKMRRRIGVICLKNIFELGLWALFWHLVLSTLSLVLASEINPLCKLLVASLSFQSMIFFPSFLSRFRISPMSRLFAIHPLRLLRNRQNIGFSFNA